MSFIQTLALAMGSSWVSGINLYAGVATLGLLGRFAHLNLPGDLNVVTNWWVIGIAGALYVIEFFADKVPFLDSAWDALHTFIRVPAGAVLAAAAFGDFDKTVQVVAFLIGGGVALSSHGTKAATRAALNTSPEPVSNVSASLAEDVVAVGSISLAPFYPIIVIAIVVIGVAVSVILVPRIIRYLRSVRSRLSRIVGSEPSR
ncbi:MAG TPA: DUF4126 domain-containing protein [Blastocatellia bacterium]|nr:DUF4126 domain-containing protein [Blastocatellia bacterium]